MSLADPELGGLVLVGDYSTRRGGPVAVECPVCQRMADRVMAYGPPGQRGGYADAHRHRLLPCGHVTARPVVFDLRGRPA